MLSLTDSGYPDNNSSGKTFIFTFVPMKLRLFVFLSIVFVALSSSCRKDLLIEDSSARLEFSDDTVIFDTVFTTIGSVTKYLKVYNRHNRSIKISSIRIASGNLSSFRMNVDGVPATNATEIILRSKDSLFIFVEVTVNPNNTTNPMIITDSIIFETNGNFQDVDLAAWGQDANFYYYPVFGDFTLNSMKPHVFYGYGLVDSAATLTIDAGARIYFHKNSGLIVLSEGTLKVNGTSDNRVIFQGDRLEWSYRNVPGQWDMIWFSNLTRSGRVNAPGSRNNEINYAVIKNGNIGLRVDTNGSNWAVPTLKITNSVVQNMSGVALLGEDSYIEAANCIFANAGQYVAALVYGGDYRFRHCTFANYWNYGKRDTPLLLLNNYYEISSGIIARDLSGADFENCIIFGANTNEIELDDNSGAAFEYKFNYCLLKTDISTSDANRFIGIILNPGSVVVDGQAHDPVFTDVAEHDFHLFGQSVAIDKGNAALTDTLNSDLDGNSRGAQPDLGALEYMP